MRRSLLIFAYMLGVACGTNDTTPPAPPIVDPIDSPTPATMLRVSGTAEFSSTVDITDGGATATAVADPYTARWFAMVTLAPGSNRLTFTATDEAGNASDPTVVDVTQGPLGTVPPFSIALQLAQPSAFVGIPIGFTIIAVDARGNPAELSTLEVTTSDASAMVSLVNRAITFATAGAPAHTVTARLFGGTPNEVSATVSVFVSAITNQPPSVAITSPANNAEFADDFTVTVTAASVGGLAQIHLQATGAVGTFQQQLVPLDAGTGRPPTGPYVANFTVRVPGGAIGTATLVAQATDIYGNAMTSPAVTVIIDPARAIIVGGGVTVSTVSARGLLRDPHGVAVGPGNLIYVANNNDGFPLVVRIDPTGQPLANQTSFVTPQPGRAGEDIVFSSGANGFFITTSGVDRIARVDAAGGNLMLGWSAAVGRPAGLVVESSTSIAAIYSDQRVRRFNATAAGPNTAPTSSMDASNNLGGSWGLEVLSFGCRAGQYRCGNGTCIANTNVCDTNNDCGDGSDEGAGRCTGALSFRCNAGAVVSTPVINICSGQAQCADASDEAGCSRYAASDAGSNDEAWSFYDGGNGNTTAFDLRLDNGLADPRGLALSPSGSFLYVASRGGNAIYQISAAGILTRNPCPGGCPTVATGFDEAWGLAFQANGDLLVTDRATDVVYRIAGLP